MKIFRYNIATNSVEVSRIALTKAIREWARAHPGGVDNLRGQSSLAKHIALAVEQELTDDLKESTRRQYEAAVATWEALRK